MDIGAVLNTKLHEHVPGPVIPQRPGMLPAEELRWGFIGVGEGRLRAFGKGGRKGKFRDVLCYGPVKVELNETEGGERGVMAAGVCGEVRVNLGRIQSARVEREGVMENIPHHPKVTETWTLEFPWELAGAPRKCGTRNLRGKGRPETLTLPWRLPATRWHFDSEPGTAIFRSWGRPQQLPLLIWSGKALEEGGTWPPQPRDPHSVETLEERNPDSPSHLSVSRNVQIRNRRPTRGEPGQGPH